VATPTDPGISSKRRDPPLRVSETTLRPPQGLEVDAMSTNGGRIPPYPPRITQAERDGQDTCPKADDAKADQHEPPTNGLGSTPTPIDRSSRHPSGPSPSTTSPRTPSSAPLAPTTRTDTPRHLVVPSMLSETRSPSRPRSPRSTPIDSRAGADTRTAGPVGRRRPGPSTPAPPPGSLSSESDGPSSPRGDATRVPTRPV